MPGKKQQEPKGRGAQGSSKESMNSKHDENSTKRETPGKDNSSANKGRKNESR